MKINLFKDVRFWIAIGFVVRLFGITNPPLETSHHWRQATVAMVARNLVTDDFDVFHPRMDTAGELSGITGMEFPLLNLIVAFCISVFGPEHWYGRLVVLVLSALGTYSLHLLVARNLGYRTALYTTIILTVSLWFMYSRKVMPDIFALSLVIMGLERFEKSTRGDAKGALIAAMLLICAGTLSKITAGCLLAAIPIMLTPRQQPWPVVVRSYLAILAACTPALLWYSLWVPHLVEEYGYWHFFMGKPITQGALELWENLPRTLDNFYFDAVRYSGFAVFLWGLYMVFQKRKYDLIALVILQCTAFLYIMLRSGSTFWIHAYYVLPFIPLMALIGGVGLSLLKNQTLARVLLTIVAIEGLASQWNDFRISKAQAFLLDLENDVSRIIPDTALIAINSADVPTPMYFAHRRGWLTTNRLLSDTSKLDSLHTLGCDFVIVLKEGYEGDVPLRWTILQTQPQYDIYEAHDGRISDIR